MQSPIIEKIIDAEHNPRKVKAERILGFFEDRIMILYRILTDLDYKGLVLHRFVICEELVYSGISKKGISNITLRKLKQAFFRINTDGSPDKIINKDR